MPKTKPVSFRMASKYVVFLDSLVGSHGRSRAHVLSRILQMTLTHYLATGDLPVMPKPPNR